MDVKTILSLIFAGVLASNYAFQHFLGVTSVLSGCSTACKSVGLGLAVTVVMVLSSLSVWALGALELLAGLEAASLLMFVLVVLFWTAVTQAVCKAVSKKSLGAGFGMIALNSAVLGGCLMNQGLTMGETALSALGAGLGFLVALVVYGELRARVNDNAVPSAFRGLPISLLTAAMICLALMAF